MLPQLHPLTRPSRELRTELIAERQGTKSPPFKEKKPIIKKKPGPGFACLYDDNLVISLHNAYSLMAKNSN